MSLLSRIKDAVRAPLATSFPQRRTSAGGIINFERELPWLHEQIRYYQSVVPVRVAGRGAVANFTNEDAEMRRAYRAALAEPSVKAALLGKISAVMSLGLQCKPPEGSNNPLTQTATSFVKDALNNAKGATKGWIGVPALVWEILGPMLIDGYGVAEKVWQKVPRGQWDGKITLDRLKSKDTQFINYELDQYRNIVGVVSYRGNSGQTFNPSDFVITSYLPMFGDPFGMSDIRAAYRAASMIPSLIRLRMVYLDKYAGPYIHAKVSDPALITRMETELAQARAEGFIVTMPGDDLELINLATGATSDFQEAISDLRQEVAISISGAFLTMMTGQGGGQMRGDASVQQDTVDLFIWMLASLVAGVINEQIVPDLVGPNFGDNCEYPVVSLEAPNPEKVVSELQIDKMLQELGVPLDLDELYERTGRRQPKPGRGVMGSQQQPKVDDAGLPIQQPANVVKFSE